MGGGVENLHYEFKVEWSVIPEKLFSSCHFCLLLPSGLSPLQQLSDLTLSLILGSSPRQKPEPICFGLSYHSISHKPCLSLLSALLLLCISCQELKGMTFHTVTCSSCWVTSLFETWSSFEIYISHSKITNCARLLEGPGADARQLMQIRQHFGALLWNE